MLGVLGLAVLGIVALCGGIICLVKAHEIAKPKRKLALAEYDRKMQAIEEFRLAAIKGASDDDHIDSINKALDTLAGSYKPRRRSWGE